MNINNNYKISFLLFAFIVGFSLLCCTSGQQRQVINNDSTIRLKQPHFVYKKSSESSSITNIFSGGKTVRVKVYSDGWLKLLSTKNKGAWLKDNNKNVKSEVVKNTYPHRNFSIPKRGLKQVKIFKIAGRYAINVKNANAKLVFKRFSTLEKLNISIPSELSPISLNVSSGMYYEVMDNLKRKGFFIYNESNNMIVPFMWDSNSFSKNHLFDINYCPNGISVIRPDNTSSISKTQNGYIASIDGKLIVLNKMRKIITQKLIANITKDYETTPFAFTHFNNSNFVVIQKPDGPSEEGPTNIYFINRNLKVIKKYNYQEMIFEKINFSANGKRIFISLKENGYESIPEKIHLVFNKKGNIINSVRLSNLEHVYYNKSYKERISLNHHDIRIENIDSSAIKIVTSPFELKDTWLTSVGEKGIAIGKNNNLIYCDIHKGEIKSVFNLSENYRFISISDGNMILLGSSNSQGTWSVIDLERRKINTTRYKGSVYREFPTIIKAFPKSKRYLLQKNEAQTRYLVFGDSRGRIFKSRIFKAPLRILNTNFITNSVIKVTTVNGEYYLPIRDVIRRGRKVK